jgi:hypothetical protein
VFVSRKSPVTVMLENVSLELPVSVNSILCGVVVLPTCSVPKFSTERDKLTLGVLKYKVMRFDPDDRL